MEGDDCASLTGNSKETVDLGDPPVLDSHVHDFLLGTEASGSRGDKPN